LKLGRKSLVLKALGIEPDKDRTPLSTQQKAG
jgi:hypothetical protein